MSPLNSTRWLIIIALAAATVQTACAPDRQADASIDGRAAGSGPNVVSSANMRYGAPVELGEGKVRTYVAMDEKTGRTPLEIGIAVDARAMEGKLPGEMLMTPLPFPENAPEPYRFALFDWNPEGHIPEGVYDVPHFDFHFYIVPHAEVEAIRREDPSFAAKANNLPKGDFVPPHYIVPAPPGVEPAALTEPRMGLHWEDMRDPQLQKLLGNPDAYQPFTKTMIYGSWDGSITFIEPMITREYLLRRTNETIPIPQPARYPKPGWYPGAYRISYDANAKEYRVAIVDFTWRE
jgi:hypothetical protein